MYGHRVLIMFYLMFQCLLAFTQKFQTILVLPLEGYKSSATSLTTTTATSLEKFARIPLQLLNLSSHSHQDNVGLLLRAILRL